MKIPQFIIDLANNMIIKREQQMSSPFHQKLKSNHMCAILDKNGKILSFGSNCYNLKIDTTEHAEAQALRKLIERIGRNNKKITIDILVIRTTGGNSKPCDECITRMYELSQRFKIRNIFYTNEFYFIDCVKFSKL
jgi:cytidine deaminase